MSNGVGFARAVHDHLQPSIDLNTLLIAHPAATFLMRVEGSLAEQAYPASGDLLVVDRALVAKNGDLVVAIVRGELVIRRYKKEGSSHFLIKEGSRASIEESVEIWGVIVYGIHSFRG